MREWKIFAMTRCNNTPLAQPTSKLSQIAPCSIRSELQRLHEPFYNAIFSAPLHGVWADLGVAWAKPRQQASDADSHFHGSFWSEIAFQDILESPSGADVHSQGRLSSSDLGFRIKCLYSRHCVVPRLSRKGPKSGSTTQVRPVTEANRRES